MALPYIARLEHYEQYIGAEAVERMLFKAEKLSDRRIVHINSTYYGGGVAELLGSMTLLSNTSGVRMGWRVIQGSPDFFGVTKKMHNALQGGEINLSWKKFRIYEHVVYENVLRNHIDHDIVVIHDPQPLPMVRHYPKKGPWIWVCHVDLSNPNPGLWRYIKRYAERYDAAVFSIPEYRREISTPQVFIMPAIDPFSIKNRDFSEEEINERLERYGIPNDKPLVVQISRFDKWKDPGGVIEAFKIARRQVDCNLVLLGNIATDDPEGLEVYNELKNRQDENIMMLTVEDTALVNALQRKASVVLQKSIREGFGLTVTEAMWKGTPVIGGNVGGIRHQITDGENGYLVDSVEEAAERIVTLLKDPDLRRAMGEKGRESVRKRFLMSRYLEDYFDLFNSFEARFKLIKPVWKRRHRRAKRL
ncbi:MAG: glycosyltransferase [Synergistota bacterium]|nr:glycosyltransferase [Synergistota bacterium]